MFVVWCLGRVFFSSSCFLKAASLQAYTEHAQTVFCIYMSQATKYCDKFEIFTVGFG